MRLYEEQNNLVPKEQHLGKEVSQCPQTPSMRQPRLLLHALDLFVRFPNLLLLCFP